MKCWRKNLAQILKNFRTFYLQKLSLSSQNMGLGSEIRDPGSGKNLFWIPDPGVKKAQDPGFRIQSRNTGCEGKKLTHLVSWFVSLLDMLWRTRFSVSLVSSSIFSWNSREQSILVWNFSVFICRRFQMLLKFVCPGRWKARPNIFIAIKINQSS